jgi:hypothetical protein
MKLAGSAGGALFPAQKVEIQQGVRLTAPLEQIGGLRRNRAFPEP